jgi:hypothetical protein
MTTKLADMIVPEEFNNYVLQLTLENSRLLQSGIMEDMSDVVGAQLAGLTINMPFVNDLTGAEEVVDDDTDLTVAKVTTGQDIAVKMYRAKAFGATDLAADLAGFDPITLIARRFATYWNNRMEIALLSTLAGAMAATNMTANVHDITALTGALANFDAESFVDAAFKLSEQRTDLVAVGIHPITMANLVKTDMIETVPDSTGVMNIPTYLGMRVIESSAFPYNSGTGNFTTYIFGRGAIGFAENPPKVPVEVGRDSLKGGGQEWIVQRRNFLMHPRGIKWIGTPVGPTPTNVELSTAANWSRVFDARNIKIIAFKHKVAA